MALVTKGGSSYGKILEIGPEMGAYEIPLPELQPVKTVTMPRPYPTFLSYYFESNKSRNLNIRDIEAVQFSIGPGIPVGKLEEKHGVALVSLRLE